MRRTAIVAAISMLALTQAAHATPPAGARGTLSAEVAAHGPILRLSDLLSEPTRTALSSEANRQADSLVVARLGMNAQPFEITGRALADVLLHAAPDLWRRIPTLTAHDRVRVVPVLQAAPIAPLLEHVRSAWIERCVAGGGHQCTAASRASVDDALLAPRGRISYALALPARPLEAPSTTSVPVTVRIDDIPVGTLSVQVDWQASVPAWRLRVPLQRHAALLVTDVDAILAPASKIERTATRLDVRSGLLRAATDLDAGTLIPATDPALLAAVRVGDEIPIRIAVGHISASRRATAVQDGRVGRAMFIRFDDRDLAVATVPAARQSRAIAPEDSLR
jgi:hypothetical protein